MIKITEIDNLESWREQWRGLISRTNINNPFLTHEWMLAWWRHFGRDNQLFALAIETENNVSAIIPLMVKRTNFCFLPITKVQFMGTGEANYLDFISGAISKEILSALLQHITMKYKWTIIDLTDINDSSVCLKAFKEDPPDNYSFSIIESEVCPYITLDQDWDSLFRKKLKRKTRYNLGRQIKRLQAKGKLEFVRKKNENDWGILIPKAIKLYQDNWRNKYNLSSFLRDEHAPFYIDIAKDLSRQGCFDFSYLLLNAEMVAFSYGFNLGGIFIDYLIGYDAKLSEYSPGSCLLRFQVEEMCKENLKVFDFSKGQEPYKSRWMSAESKNYRIIIANKDLYAKLVWIIYVIYFRIRYVCKGFYILRRLRKDLLGWIN